MSFEGVVVQFMEKLRFDPRAQKLSELTTKNNKNIMETVYEIEYTKRFRNYFLYDMGIRLKPIDSDRKGLLKSEFLSRKDRMPDVRGFLCFSKFAEQRIPIPK